MVPPEGVTIVGTVPMAGYSCSIIGHGIWQADDLSVQGSVIRATAQTGPVLGFTGFEWPKDFRARLRFEDFAVIGDGTAGTAKKGVYIPPRSRRPLAAPGVTSSSPTLEASASTPWICTSPRSTPSS